MNNVTLLSDLATEIKAEHAAATGSFEVMARTVKDWQAHAIRAGELLIEAKKHHRHGEWGDWIDNYLQISQRTVQAYMRVARNVDKIDQTRSVADFSLRQVMKQITDKNRTAKPKPTPTSADVSHQVEEMRGVWNRAGPETRQAFREWVEPASSATREEPVATVVSTDAHIFERMFGPLSGAEWAEIAEDSYRRPVARGPYKRPGRYSDAFLKLAQHFSVPVAELEAAE